MKRLICIAFSAITLPLLASEDMPMAFLKAQYEAWHRIKKENGDLKMKDYARRNRASQIKAMTMGQVTLSEKVNYKGEDDYLETDYHD